MRLRFFSFLIIMLLGSTAGAIDKVPVDPQCFLNYLDGITSTDLLDGSYKIRNLPKKIIISVDEVESTQMFALANAAWTQESHLAYIRKAVDRIVEGDNQVITGTLTTEMKSSRKYGTMIRNAFNLFDVTHEVPEALDQFVVRFGKLNDAIKLGSKKDTLKAARKLQESFDLLPDEEMIQYFNPENRAGFKQYMQGAVEDIKKSLKKKKLSSEEFHNTRKSIRRLASFFQAKQAAYPHPEDIQLAQFLRQLSDALGEEHDEMVKRAFEGKVKYKKATGKFSDGMRERLEAVVDRIDLGP